MLRICRTGAGTIHRSRAAGRQEFIGHPAWQSELARGIVDGSAQARYGVARTGLRLAAPGRRRFDPVFLRLLLLLTVVPLVELTILLRIAERFDWGPTIALVLVTGALGAWLARREGLKTLGRIQNEMAQGIPPTGAMVDGLLILVAGVVLVTPGILTDMFGFVLLIPPCRAWIRRRLSAAFKRHVVVMHRGAAQTSSGPEPFVDVTATSREADHSDREALP